MAAKTVFVFCATILLVQMTSSCPTPRRVLQAPSCGFAAPAISSSGGVFLVSSASTLAPTGLSVLSQNTIQGSLNVGGKLPFLGTVAFEGGMPSAGSAGVNYSCGNGNVGIAERAGAVAPYAAASGLAANNIAGAGFLGNKLARPCARSVLY